MTAWKIFAIDWKEIFELPVDSLINCEHILLYERQSPEGTMQRFFCKEKPDNAVLVKPNLEDVFLVVYRDER